MAAWWVHVAAPVVSTALAVAWWTLFFGTLAWLHLGQRRDERRADAMARHPSAR